MTFLWRCEVLGVGLTRRGGTGGKKRWMSLYFNMLVGTTYGARMVGINPRFTLGFGRNLLLKPNFSKFKKIPQPPGNIVGTVNDAYKHPLVSPYEGNYHWTYERILAISLLPLSAIQYGTGFDYPMVDTAFCMTLLFHAHSGIKSCIIDYIPKRVYGIWHKVAVWFLSLGTFAGGYGVYLLETNENGLFDLVSKLWNA